MVSMVFVHGTGMYRERYETVIAQMEQMTKYWRDPKCLLTIFGGEHALGGIPGYEAAETTDENPERVAAVQQLSWAYLRSALYPDDSAWAEAVATLGASANPQGQVTCK